MSKPWPKSEHVVPWFQISPRAALLFCLHAEENIIDSMDGHAGLLWKIIAKF